MTVTRLTTAAMRLALLACPWTTAAAQWQADAGPRSAALGAPVGGSIERYLRAAAVAGRMHPLPTAARGLLPAELRAAMLADSTPHPWRAALLQATRDRRAAGAQLFVSANSSMPWGANDGAMWQGRGLNAALGAGAVFETRHLTALAAPALAFSQNAGFPLMPQFFPERLSDLVDPQYTEVVDLPQRRGIRPETRLLPGESSLRVSAFGLTAGISSASEGWGPGETFPAILGANAGGFSRIFAGTNAAGVRLGPFGTLSARYVLGVLEQSNWSIVTATDTFASITASGRRRMATGLSASFTPAALQALEIGATRFYHLPWRGSGRQWTGWAKPFSGLFSGDEVLGPAAADSISNQLGSLFIRVRVPKARLETTVELLRDDYNYSGRDLVQEPENNGALLSSVRIATSSSASAISLLTIELFDGDIRPIAQQRPQGALYTNGSLLQGHTSDGQLLGAPIGAGVVSGQRVAWERFTATGSRRIALQRWRPRSVVITDVEGLYRPPPVIIPKAYDWLYDLSAATLDQRGAASRSLEVGALYAGVWQLRRTAWNVYARASTTIF
ncbi:MAG: hypothetical protein IT355_09980 [Gemmatimonadaceae bacterium]|nr:hypothetical protein [Gemmatimonadaceae bacterium]